MPLPEPIIDGDTFFTGVNMRLDPGQLQPGLCAFARNKRFVTGKAVTRPGIKKMAWSNRNEDPWTNDDTKEYAIGDVVTYSGVSALVSGSSASQVDGGTGSIALANANSLSPTNTGFSVLSPWVIEDVSLTNWIHGSGVVNRSGVSGAVSTSESFVNASPTPTGDFGSYAGNIPSESWVTSGSGSGAGFRYTIDAQLTGNPTFTIQSGGTGFREGDTITITDPTATSTNTAVLVVNKIDGDTNNIYIDVGTTLGCSYTVRYEVTNWSSGAIQAFISETESGTRNLVVSGQSSNTFTDTIIVKGPNPQRLYIQASPGFAGTLDNVTITSDNLPDEVDILGTFEQSTNQWRAAGPASNNTIGPYFKSKTASNSDNPPITTYTPVNGGTPASSTIDGTNWEDLGHRIYGYGTVHGVGIFRDPQSIEYLLVAGEDGVYATKEANPSIKLAGVTSFTEDVAFVQCFNVVILLRGENLEPLVMERIDEGFKSITPATSDTDIEENDSDGTEKIPNASTGLFFANRLLIPHHKDLVAASDFLNYTRYQPVMANFRINQGSEDELVSLVRINSTTVACFKSNSIYIVSNIYGNMADLVLDEVTREYGAIGKNSIVQVGSDVAFLSSKRGITSLAIADNGKVTAVDVPLSEAIQPLIDRINWNAASNAAAAYHNNRLYMAVPIDGSTHNNVILVYDFLMKAWAGYDDGEAVKVKQFVETMHQGKRRLFFLSTDGYINLYDDILGDCGFVDEKPLSTVSSHADFGKIGIDPISDEIITRGYTAGDITTKKWKSAEIQMATNDPNFTVATQFEGPEENDLELTPIGGKTFSRTKYDRPFDKSDFVQSMVNNDFTTKFREDYSVKLAGEEDGVDAQLKVGVCSPSPQYTSQSTCETWQSGRTWVYNSEDKGFDPDLHQNSNSKYSYRGDSRFVQLKITNTKGRVEVIGTKVGATPGENLTNIKI